MDNHGSCSYVSHDLPLNLSPADGSVGVNYFLTAATSDVDRHLHNSDCGLWYQGAACPDPKGSS